MAHRHRKAQRARRASRSKGGLSFLGATSSPETTLTFGAFSGYIEPGILEIMQDSMKILGACIANARSFASGRESEPRLEILLGLALLTFSEAQALLLLCSGGLERSSRIHLRSLYEYRVRAKLMLNDPSKAERFLAAAIAELDHMSGMIGVDPKLTAEAKARFLGTIATPLDSQREKRVIGDMASVIKADSGPRSYGAAYAHPSQFSHGSILALDEVSRALSQVGNNFQQNLIRDGRGFSYLVIGASYCCDMAVTLAKQFGIDAGADLVSLLAKLDIIREKRKADLIGAAEQMAAAGLTKP